MVSGLSRLSRRYVSQTDKVTGEPGLLSPKWRGRRLLKGLGIWPPEWGDRRQPGSIRLDLMTEIAAGVVRYFMNACPAALSLALVPTPPVRTM